MSWSVIIVLIVGAFGLKALGVVGLGRAGGSVSARFESFTILIPAALFAALVAVQTVADEDALTLDARVFGVAAGAIAVWRRAPFVVVVVISMAVTAFARWQTWL